MTALSNPLVSHRRGCRARAALLWGLAAFATFQAGLAVAIEYRFTGLRDEEYSKRLTLLRRCLAAAPDRPLVLFMGSSRTLNGVIPSELPDITSAGTSKPIAFNFGHTAAGALEQMLLLRRVLHEGVRPEHVYLEVMPALLAVEGEAYGLVVVGGVGWEDWPVLRRYWPKGLSRWNWCKDNLLSAVTYRERLLSQLFPGTLAPAPPHYTFWNCQDDHGFLPCAFGLAAVTPERYAVELDRSRREYLPLLAHFHVALDEERAMREFLRVCRQRRIGVTLVLMPESSAFRSWYAPPAAAQLDTFLAGLRRDYGVAVVDGRTWVQDQEFYDGHHLLAKGARTFTRRFGREVYGPFLRGRAAFLGEPGASATGGSGR
jgi:hypothetical protein